MSSCGAEKRKKNAINIDFRNILTWQGEQSLYICVNQRVRCGMNECGKMEQNCNTTNIPTLLIMHYHFIYYHAFESINLLLLWNLESASMQYAYMYVLCVIVIIAWYIINIDIKTKFFTISTSLPLKLNRLCLYTYGMVYTKCKYEIKLWKWNRI